MSTWEQLTIYVGESDHWHRKPLYMALVEEARRRGRVGATATRGIAGFGKRNHQSINTAQIWDLSSDLPVVVTVIDWTEAIVAFLPIAQEMVKGGLITQEIVTVVHHVPAAEEKS